MMAHIEYIFTHEQPLSFYRRKRNIPQDDDPYNKRPRNR
jgi:hypothetical protein